MSDEIQASSTAPENETGSLESIAANLDPGTFGDPTRARVFLSLLLGETFAQRHRAASPPRIEPAIAATYRMLCEAPGGVGQASFERAGGPSLLPGLAALRTHTRDVPFLVESLRRLLEERGYRVHLLLHPIFQVRRDDTGALRELAAPSAGSDPSLHESLIHVEVSGNGRGSPGEIEQAALEVLNAAHTVDLDESAMRARLTHLVEREIDEPAVAPPTSPELMPAEAVASFCRWLLDGNFTFLGARTYAIEDRKGVPFAVTVRGSGLGLLRDEDRSAFATPASVESVSAGLRERILLERRLVIDKTNRPSPIHQREPMDYIGIRFFREGRFQREERFVGLFTAKALFEPPTAVPILRTKYQRMLERAGIVEGSFDEREITGVFNALPKQELFLNDSSSILAAIRTILEAYAQDQLRLFSRPTFSGRLLAIGIVIPDRYFSTEGIDRVVAHLETQLGARILERRETRTEQGFRQIYLYAAPRPPAPPDTHRLEAEVVELLRPWEERLAECLPAGTDSAWATAFPAAYRDQAPVLRASADIALLAALDDSQPYAVGAVHPGDPQGGDPTATLLRIAHRQPLTLGAVMPVLKNLALEVIDEAAFEVAPENQASRFLHVFRVRGRRGELLDRGIVEGSVLEGLRRVLEGQSEDDPLNGLMSAVGLSWRQVWIVRAYVNHAFQLGLLPSRVTAASSLLTAPALARSLVRWFETRFDPEPSDAEREHADADIAAELARAIEVVEDPTDYKVFRVLRDLIGATVRTNHFRAPVERSRAIAIKIETTRLSGVPRPVPKHEIFVQAPGMEGVHLRGGDVARGGIRFSDRPDDYRTEVLGLMKTQMVKNAIIVPEGAKGGFILTAPPTDRTALGREALEAYQTFISALLDVTDNRVVERVIPPARVVRLDGDDPYLVVAADKGTAAYSDVANAISARYGFWLGDAFASGGSRGYDHKKLGITAKGAWECAKTHFWELGVDPESEPLTVVGIGDMSGDVFGNGLLRSRTMKLIGAFNHRHVFLDPDPDPERSFRERERCFREALGWDGYDTTAISAGGGVFARRQRSIPIPPSLRPILGTDRDAASGDELIRLLLTAQVALLWNGGIGTYVKSSTEAHSDVGDKSNDAVRIDASQLRCSVVAEGGNLGFTQAARTEFAAAGGRIHTDAIDNSGGVDCSDHEVNVKIALATARARGEIDFESETRALVEATDEICAQVLSDNRAQSLVLALDQRLSKAHFEIYQDMIGQLAATGHLDPEADGFSKRELKTQRGDGHGFFKPQLAVLLAGEKRRISGALVRGTLIDREELGWLLTHYFPESLRRRIPAAIAGHPLRREIVATALANWIVNRSGLTMVSELERETGASTEDVIGAWLVVDEVLDGEVTFASIGTLAWVPPRSESSAILSSLQGMNSTLVRATKWNAQRKRLLAPNAHDIARYRERRHAHLAAVEATRGPLEAKERDTEIERLRSFGVPERTCHLILDLEDLRSLFAIGSLADETGVAPDRALAIFTELGSALRVNEVHAYLERVPLADAWDRLAARRIADQTEEARFRIAMSIIRSDTKKSVQEIFAQPTAAARRFLDAVDRLKATAAPRNLHASYVVAQALSDLAVS